MPKRLTKEKSTATETYAKFVAEPFETGYGHTIGNSLRRVLLSSLEGAAITSIKVDGAMHEFATIEGVVEDVTDIVLNLKKILFKAHTRDPQTLLLQFSAKRFCVRQNLPLIFFELVAHQDYGAVSNNRRNAAAKSAAGECHWQFVSP